ncbi:hypothetical protein GCM10008929_16390 [Alkalibacterium psychrotolerans]
MNNFNKELKSFINKQYKDYKKDLFSIFIYRCTLFTKKNGYTGLMTPMVWMFISSYEKLRNYIINHKSITSLVHLEYSAFKDATVPLCTFVLKNEYSEEKGTYIRLTEFTGGMHVQEEKYLEAKNDALTLYRYERDSNGFNKIPGSIIAYWAGNTVFKIFENSRKIENISTTRIGMATANNERFMRLWYEVNGNKVSYNSKSREKAKESGMKWFPFSKGGRYRKWAGNQEYLVNWENDGNEIRNYKDEKTGRVRSHNYNLDYIFNQGITFTAISSSRFACRYIDSSLFGSGGSGIFSNNINESYVILALLNSNVSYYLLQLLSSTMNFEVNTVGSLPYICIGNNLVIDDITKQCIGISICDWNSFETSWDFEEHPFLTHKEDASLIKDSFNNWKVIADERFYQLKENEEELNRIFIDIYGLQDELTPEVEEKDVTVNKAKLDRDVKSFLSYLVGIMFGRYSLDKKGLAYAGGEWDESQYTSYKPDDTNIIPLTEDQYFEDDIMNKVEELVSLIYGKETLEENLRFIAEALKMKSNESARDRIRRYFMKEFYKDHLKTYQKRPIYWQFTSGKRGAFKGLMYLHRYHKYTVAQLRTEYILHQATVLDNLITHEQQVIGDETSSATQKARAQKTIDEYTKDRAELAKYDQIIEHVARQQIDLDLDDGVKENYELFQNIEVTDDTSNKPKKQYVFEKI